MDQQSQFVSLVEHPRRRVIAFLFLLMSMFLATLDNQIVSTALPTIVGEFGAVERFGWVASAYLLASCAVMPIYGKLGDLIGRKYVLMAAIVIFLVGSLTCGLAVSMNTLIAARVLQGFGGGGLMVSIFSLNADLFPARERAKYQSYASLVLMTSGALGPILGGTMTAAFGWRSIFLVNLPVGLIVLAGLHILLPNRKTGRKPKIDFLGALLLALMVTGIVLWCDSGEIFGSMLSPASFGVVAAVAVLTGLWVMVERRAPEPMIPLSLFSNRTVVLLLIISIASGSIAIGMVNYLALFLQTVPVPLGLAVGARTGGRLMSIPGRYRPLAILGLSLSTLAFVTLSLFAVSAPLALMAAILGLHGLGIGFGQQVPVLGAHTAARGGDVGAATGTVTLSRMVGASAGISIYGAILAYGLDRSASIPGVGPLTELSPTAIAALPEPARALAIGGYGDTFTMLFMFAAAVCMIGLVAALALRPMLLGAPAQAAESA